MQGLGGPAARFIDALAGKACRFTQQRFRIFDNPAQIFDDSFGGWCGHETLRQFKAQLYTKIKR